MPGAVRAGHRRDAQRIEMQFADVIRAFPGEQARLESKKGQRVVGAQRTTPNPALVAVKAAWHIERQPGAGQAIGLRNPACVITGDVACQAHSEQAVDHQAVSLRRGDIGQDGSTTLKPGFPGVCGIRRQAGRVGTAHDDDAKSLCRKVACGDQCVAAIVPRPCQDQDGFARFAGQGACQFSRRRAGFFHQGVVGMRFRPCLLAGTDVGGHE